MGAGSGGRIQVTKSKGQSLAARQRDHHTSRTGMADLREDGRVSCERARPHWICMGGWATGWIFKTAFSG